MDKIIARLNQNIKTNQITDFGLTELKTPLSIDIYKEWLNNNFHGDMKYLEEHFEQKKHPQTMFKKATSAIIITKNYFPIHPKNEERKLPSLNIASYARGEDYHFWFKQQLDELCEQFKLDYPEDDFISFTDSAPILERDLAYQAGIGWYGKNSMLIHSKQGSLFFIGEIFTSLKLESIKPIHPDRCGTCSRCIDACPTNAILDSKKIDASKCISYLNIESKDFSVTENTTLISDWFFGCDVCQTVCPWNEKVFGKDQLTTQKAKHQSIEKDLNFILSKSNKELMRTLSKTPLTRARGAGLKRNAIIVATNLKLISLQPIIESYKDHEKLGEIARWSLKKLREAHQ